MRAERMATRRSARMRSSRAFIPRMRPDSPDGQLMISDMGLYLIEKAVSYEGIQRGLFTSAMVESASEYLRSFEAEES